MMISQCLNKSILHYRTNLYLLVLTHRYVADRREALQKIMRNAKTVTFKDIRSTTKQFEE